MTAYSICNIIKDVRVALDQNATSETLTLISDVETLSLDDIIKSKILEAVKYVHSQAPLHLLDGALDFNEDDVIIDWGTLESGCITLPGDFMRLVVFRMSDWERPVFNAINVNSPEYAKQSSRFKGVRGSSQNPICAISMQQNGKTLEFFSCKSEDATISTALYIPYPSIDSNVAVDICERCYQAVIYTTASLALMAYNESNQSVALSNLAKSSLI